MVNYWKKIREELLHPERSFSDFDFVVWCYLFGMSFMLSSLYAFLAFMENNYGVGTAMTLVSFLCLYLMNELESVGRKMR